MKMVTGLGNPEPKYSWTRHNLGKETLNQLFVYFKLQDKTLKWQNLQNNQGQYFIFKDTFYYKPDEYMNNIGVPIAKAVNYYKIVPEEILVVYDELDLVVGRYKFLFGKYSKIHNGMKSIARFIDPQKCWHLRIGVRDPKIEMSVQKTGQDPGAYLLAKVPASHKKNFIELNKNILIEMINQWSSKKILLT